MKKVEFEMTVRVNVRADEDTNWDRFQSALSTAVQKLRVKSTQADVEDIELVGLRVTDSR